MERRLYRTDDDRVVAGVCGGVAEYFGVDPVLVRLAWVLFTLVVGTGALFYVLAWFVMPNEQGNRSSIPLVLLFLLFVFPSVCCGCSMFASLLG